jgi:hypothetical protein
MKQRDHRAPAPGSIIVPSMTQEERIPLPREAKARKRVADGAR